MPFWVILSNFKINFHLNDIYVQMPQARVYIPTLVFFLPNHRDVKVSMKDCKW